MGRYTVRVPFYDDTYLNKKLTAQQTNFEVLRGKISAIISDSEIEEYRNGNITMASRLSSAIQTVDGFSQQVSSLENEYNAATGEFSALKSKVSSFEQTVDGFTQQVSSWETIQQQNADDIDDINEALGNYVLTSELGSKIEQTAGSIDLKVFKNTTLAKKTDLNDYTKTANLNQYISSNKSQLGLDDGQIVAKVTGSSYWSTQATAIENLQDAQDEIDQLVSNIQATANAKSTVYYGSSTPVGTTANPLKTGDLWIDSAKNSIKRYTANNNKWTAVDNKDIANALTAAGTAQATADGKIQTFTGTAAQRTATTSGLDIGDLWFTTDDDNKPFRWNGSQWVSVQDGFIELANQLASDAKSLAEKKVTTYTSRTAPTKTTHPDLSDGDLWFNTTTAKDPVTGAFVAKNDVKRWDESQTPPQWVDCSDIRFAEAAAGIADLDDEKAQIFLQTTKPANNAANNLDKGDLWINTNDKNRIHIWDPAANSGQGDWVVADKALDELVKWKSEAQIALTKDSIYQTITTWDGGGMELVNMINQTPEGTKIFGRHIQIEAGDSIASAITDGSIKPYYQATEPKSPKIGDIWYNTSSSNYKIYTYTTVNGTAQWVETEKDKVPKDKVINSINQTPEGTKIDAKRIEITSGSEIQLSIDKATTIGSNKSRTFRTSERPQQGTDSVTGKQKISTGDMWIDTTKGQDNKIYYWNGSNWQEDSIVSRINLSNENVMIDGGKIDISANESYSITAGDANKALAQATTRSKIFRTDKAPVQSTDSNGFPNIRQGDMWVDTESGHNNQIYIWNGLSWQQDTVVSRINASTEGTKINADKIDIVASSSLRLMVTGKSKVFAQDTKPVREKDSATDTYNFNKGDIWYDTDDNYKMYVCTYVNGTTSTWTVASQDLVPKSGVISAINLTEETASINANKISLTAGAPLTAMLNDSASNAKVFWSPKQPVQSVSNGIRNIAVGDIWYDTTAGKNKMYYCTDATDSKATWTMDKIISRINMSDETIQIEANRLKITAEDLGISAEKFRVQSTALSWSSTNSSMTENGNLWVASLNATKNTQVKGSTSSYFKMSNNYSTGYVIDTTKQYADFTVNGLALSDGVSFNAYYRYHFAKWQDYNNPDRNASITSSGLTCSEKTNFRTSLSSSGIDIYFGSGASYHSYFRKDGFVCHATTKSRAVKTQNYGTRLQYCYEMPSPSFGDIGEGVIAEDGYCYIQMDPIFLETIAKGKYQVFLQPYGEGNLYVKLRNTGHFVVAGTPGLAFAWEVKAKQADTAMMRMEDLHQKLSIQECPEGTDYAAAATQHINDIDNTREVA